MKKWIWCVCLLILIGGCERQANQPGGDKGGIRVVSANTIIADFTQAVGGGRINHTSLLKPGDDPHVYEPVPKDNIELERADIVFYNGYNLEANLIKLIKSTNVRGKAVAVAETERIKPMETEYEGKKQVDPHVWMDVKNAIIMVETIRDELIKTSPKDEAIFKENAAVLIQQLQDLDNWIRQQIASIPVSRRKLITTHDAFQYYGRAYGIKILGTLIGISTEEQPSAQTVRELVAKIRNSGVETVFVETSINPRLMETVAVEAGVRVASEKLYSDSLGKGGGEADTYVKMMRWNTNVIVKNLKGQ
ncbi:MAG: zinc ABC transporter substrate-binding protein [Geminocystis sp.]|nr:zinc ABC transporter substrate-binding protein [Geminocystis sp.]MDW8115773.1 zinc ABC transporter substrate-binding protein [Geminocystis sp.]HIK37849.1 zinc ABC transporter substrate-binding protein [Geminocystis sp. M7585_C2015_104]